MEEINDIEKCSECGSGHLDHETPVYENGEMKEKIVCRSCNQVYVQTWKLKKREKTTKRLT